MIFVLELPPDADPLAWFAFGEDDLLRKVEADDPLQPWELWDRSSARELLALFDETPESAGVSARFPGICTLAAEQGWDAALYRADHLLGRGLYRNAPVSKAEAAEAALKARGDCRLWWSEEAAVLGMEADTDPLWAGAGWKARWALREQLVATEALADS
jgi:hypothetical protein